MKFLDSTGLAHLWSKMKDYVGGQIGAIDRTLYKVITKLPDTSSEAVQLGCTDVNKIYLVSLGVGSPANQEYAEYLYRGTNFTTNYNKSNWEKLGSFRSTIDLSNCVQKTEVPYTQLKDLQTNKTEIVTAGYDGEFNKFIQENGKTVFVQHSITNEGSNDEISLAIPEASTSANGVMSARDKKNIDRLVADTYPFGITSFTNNGGVIEKGTTKTFNLSWTYKNIDFNPIKSQSLSGGSLSAATTVANGTTSYTISNLTDATTNAAKTYTYTLTSVGGSSTKTATTSVTFVHKNYAGVVAANKTSLSETDVKSLTSTAVINGKSRTVSISQNNQKIAYCYPAYFGNLTSIKDGNGFQGFGGYTKSTVTVDGVTYNVYLQNIAATSTGSYTFA